MAVYTITYKFTYVYETVRSLHIRVKIFKHGYKHLLYQCHSNARAKRMCSMENPLLSELANGANSINYYKTNFCSYS